MNERIEKLVKESGGEFWQRIESDGVLNKEAYITFDPPQSLEKFAELIVRECGDIAYKAYWDNPETVRGIHIKEKIKEHFGVEND